MQDINKMSDTDIKPMVDPSPPRDTTVTIADGGTPPLDDTTYDLLLRADTRTENRKLRHIINEPGSKYQVIYNHIVRELLNIAPDGTIMRSWELNTRPMADNFKLKYFVIDLKKDGNDHFEWVCSLERDGIIDEDQLDELLCINSYLNFVQNRTGPISDGYADITKCTRDDFVRFTKQTHTFGIEYNEKEAIESKERGTPDIEFYGDLLPACGVLPILQLPCLYGFPASRNNKDTITKSDNNELRVESVPEVELASDGDYNMGSSGGDSGDIVPTAEDDKNSILADTDKVGISLLGSSELNNRNSGGLLIGDENIHIRKEPDEIKSADTEFSSSINSAEDGITTTIAAATKIRHLFKEYCTQRIFILRRIAAADDCRNAKDRDLWIMYKVKRMQGKKIERSVSRHFTGSARLYHKAVHKMQPSVVVIQKYTRMYIAKKKVNSIRGCAYRRRTNCNHTSCGTLEASYDVSEQTHISATVSISQHTLPGTRHIPAQASGSSQQSFYIALSYESLSRIGENGERMYDADGDTGINVFAISHDHSPLPPPKVFIVRGEESSTKFYIRLDGEFLCKVEVDHGAWGEYDDNPRDVQDWQYIMIEVRKFADRSFVYEAPHSGADTVVDTEWDQYILQSADEMITLDSISGLDIVMFEKLIGNSDLELIGISSCNKIHDSQALSPYCRQWGENRNTLIYYIAYGTSTKDPRGRGAYYIVLVSILHQTFGKHTEVSRSLKLISWWRNNMNRGLVVVVLISDWIKLYINTISRYTTRDDNENDDVIGASRSTVVNTSVNNICSITITGTIINCNIPVDNNGNILGRYASSQSIIRINTTKLMYVSTTIGYNSVGSNNDMITCSSGTQHKDYMPMGITYTDRIGSERSATLNSSCTHIGDDMNPCIELIGSDKNIINNGVYVRSSCANGSGSSNATYALTTTLTDTNDQNRINIEIISTNIINFEEIKIEDHYELRIDSFEHVLLEKMGSNYLVNLRLRRKSHGLWRTTRTYQWRYSWYKLDGRGVTEFCAMDRIRIWRYASNWCWSYDEGSSWYNELIV